MADGISLRITRDEVTGLLGELGHRLAEPQPALTEIARNLVTSTRKRFKESRGPVDGLGPVRAWPALKPATIQRRRKGSSKPLLDTTDTMRSIQARVTGAAVHIGTNHEIAPGVSPAIHQLGGTKDMAPGPAGIPARPFLGIDDADVAMMRRVATAYLGSKVAA